MSQEALFRKASLFIITGPSEHLHIVMNDPVDYPLVGDRTVLLVNFCTYDGDIHDGTCVLGHRDHDFFKRPTYADYRRAVLKRADPLEADLRKRVIRLGEPFSGQIYRRILEGFATSPQVTPKISRFIRFAGL